MGLMLTYLFSIPDEWAVRGMQSWKRVAETCFGANHKEQKVNSKSGSPKPVL